MIVYVAVSALCNQDVHVAIYIYNALFIHVCSSPFELVFQTTEAEETEYMWKFINRMGG